MKDDSVTITQRLLSAHIEVKRKGATPDRLLTIARLSLALGNPDQAHDAAQAILYKVEASEAQEAEATWLKILALCLRAAILEGTAEGAPGWKIERKVDDRDFCRRQALEILREVAQDGPLGPLQAQVLRALEAEESLRMVERIIQTISADA